MSESGVARDVVEVPHGQVLEFLRDHHRRCTGMIDVLAFRFSDLDCDDETWAAALRQAGLVRDIVVLRCDDPPSVDATACIEREDRLAEALAGAPGIDFIRAGVLAHLYNARPYVEGQLAETYLAAAATLAARRVYAARTSGRRVLAMYCDGVLWQGTCAEMAPESLVVGANHRAVQEQARAMVARGWELWLVGRGEEGALRRVFERRPDMPLSIEDVSAVRLSWRSAGENLCQLTFERGVRPESIVFVADCPAAAAVSRDHCPGLLSIELPAGGRRVAHYMRHVWAFDESALRPSPAIHEAHAPCTPLVGGADHLRRTGVVRAAQPYEYESVAAFSESAIHFNTTGSRVTADELAWFAQQPAREVLTVRDGDLNGPLLGALRVRRMGAAIRVEDWWIHAGVVGHGLEGECLRAVGRRAVAAGVPTIEVAHVPSRRNEPVRRFLDGLGGERRDGEYVVSLNAALAAAVLPELRPAAPGGEALFTQRAAGTLSNPRDIRNAVRRWERLASRDATGVVRLPRTEAEQWLSSVWAELLGVERPGIDDDFFALGGDSLAAARATARVRAAFGIEFTIADLFDHPTLEAQARRLTAIRDSNPSGATASPLATLETASSGTA